MFNLFADDVCLWYRSNGNNMLNGLYSYQGTYNDYPYYLQESSDCSLPTLYMWSNTDGRWFITASLGSNSYYAACSDISNDYPINCGTNWIFGSESSTDDEAIVEIAPCPAIDCFQLKFEYISGFNSGYCVGKAPIFVICIHDTCSTHSNTN